MAKGGNLRDRTKESKSVLRKAELIFSVCCMCSE